MIQPNDFNEIENEELDHLIDQFIDLIDDFVGNAHLIVNVCERALPLARMEKKWYLFFILYDSLFLHVMQYGDSRKVIKYAQQFFLDCATILPEAAIQYSHTTIAETAVNCFGRIFSTYSTYHQITDQKLEEFIHFYEETARRYGQEFTFWRDILDYGLDIMDLDTAQRGYAGIKAHPLEGTTCYICTMNQNLGYFVLTGQHEKARALVNRIIHQRIPAKYKSAYDECPAANSACQYDRLLDFSANFGAVEEYREILETGAAQIENYHEQYGMSAGMAYHLANSGRFPYLKEYLDIFSNTVDKLEHGGRTYHLMADMIRWSIYFQKLDESSGVHQVKLTYDSPNIPAKDQNGLILVTSLSAWCDSTADRLGAQFEAVRERFHYEVFKNNHRKCAGLM